MAQRKKSEIEFIQDTFCPQVAVLCSYDAEVICRKNSLTFVELVQPFCRFSGEIKIIDPSNNPCTISNLRVEIKDINSIPPQPLIAKKILDDAVLNGLSSAQNFYEKQISNMNYNFSANLNTPWFESWRDNFIKIGYPDDHEFLKHLLSCIFVVSTSHLDPLDQFQKLNLQQQQIQTNQTTIRLPKWFFSQSTNIYKYFVLLHDAQEGEISKAHQIYETLKNTYGPSNCHLLQINSKPVNSVLSSSATSIGIGNMTNSIHQAEFDPWLQYCKFNDMYTNTLSSLAQTSSTPETDLTPAKSEILPTENDSNHPLLDRSSDNAQDSNDDSLPITNETKRHGMCLALSDHDRIKTFISEFLQRGLVPYAERTMKALNDQVQSKKSILKSFGLPRKFFGGGSSSSSTASVALSNAKAAAIIAASTGGVQSTSGSSTTASIASPITITNNFIGTNDELQLRRLADLAFMFRLYDLAYNSYHSAKKEFSSILGSNNSQTSSEQLSLMKMYFAGALEMATVASFMQNFANDMAFTSSSSLINASSFSSSTPSTIPNSISTNSLSSLNMPSSSTSISNKTYQLQYVDESIGLYSNECKNVYFSIRSVLLSTEALKATNLFLKAAYQFINLANDETDVRTALFLEQAALCYLAQPQPLIRKYAFFMSLAGHRFSRAGQKKHSLRVYKHAMEIYENRGWFKAQDYINYITSQLNFKLKNVNEALECVGNVIIKNRISKPTAPLTSLSPSSSNVTFDQRKLHSSKHNHAQTVIDITNESNVLKDFISYSNLIKAESTSTSIDKLTAIPLPVIDHPNIRVNLNPSQPSKCLKFGSILVNNDRFVEKHAENGYYKQPMWQKFEETLFTAAFHTSVSIMFKPQINFHDRLSDNKQMPKVVIYEKVAVFVDLKNPLKATTLVLRDVTLLCKFVEQTATAASSAESSKQVEYTNEINELELIDIVECSKLDEVKLIPNELKRIILLIKPLKAGHLHILGIKYHFGIEDDQLKILSADFLDSKQLFEIRGARMNNNQQAMKSVVYDLDNRLNFKIIKKTALMQVELSHLPSTMICNQLEKVRLHFINVNSDLIIGNIKIAASGLSSSRISFHDTNSKQIHSLFDKKTSICTLNKSEFKYLEDIQSAAAAMNNSDQQQHHNQRNNENDFVYSLDGVVIPASSHYELDMWIRAPEHEGDHMFYFMFFYEDFTAKLVNQTANLDMPIGGRMRKASLPSSHNLKYRTLRYEFSLRTNSAMNVSNTSVVTSQSSCNMFCNLELTNRQESIGFELVELISVSDLWKTWPMVNTDACFLKPLSNVTVSASESMDVFQQQFRNKVNRKTEEILSIALKSEIISTANSNNNKNEKLCLFRSAFKSLTKQNNGLSDENMPDQCVFLDFMRSDIKKSLINVSKDANYLDLSLIWKSTRTTHSKEEKSTSYGMTPVKVFLNSATGEVANMSDKMMINLRHHRPRAINADNNKQMELSKRARSLIIITSQCETNCVGNDSFSHGNLCSVVVSIQLRNFCSSDEFDLVILAKNPKNSDLEKKYLWLGCNKKFLKLKSNQTKHVKFRLGFASYGVFEIGQLTNETVLKMNLMDASSVTSFDDLIDNSNVSATTLNTSNMSNSTVNETSSIISIYVKNNSNNNYELLKRLNPFTVFVLKK